jgi:hypothetical protein
MRCVSGINSIGQGQAEPGKAATQQCRAKEEHVTAPVEPPDCIDTEIWRIWAECALCTAPLDTILAKLNVRTWHTMPRLL